MFTVLGIRAGMYSMLLFFYTIKIDNNLIPNMVIRITFLYTIEQHYNKTLYNSEEIFVLYFKTLARKLCQVVSLVTNKLDPTQI